MAAGVLDRLITRLELHDKFTKEAKSAKDAAKSLAKELDITEDEADQLNGTLSKFKGGNVSAGLGALMAGAEGSTSAFVRLGATGSMALGRLATVAPAVAGPAALGGIAAAITLAVSAFGALTIAANAAFPVLLAGASAFATLMGPALAKPFLDAAAEADMMKRQFAGLYGSWDKGDQMYRFTQQYGLTSPLPQPALQEGVRTLGWAGADVNQYLPVLDTLSMVAEDMNTGMQVLSNAVRYAKGGRMGEAIENLSQIGIGRNWLIDQGAKFDNQGRFEGTFEDFMDVLEKLSKTDTFQRVKANVEDSIATKMSNAGDALRLAMVTVGEVAARHVLPMIEKATTWLQGLASSPIFKQLVASWSALFTGGESTLMTIASYVLAIAGKVPDWVNAGISFVEGLLSQWSSMFQTIFKYGYDFIVKPLLGIFNPDMLKELAKIADKLVFGGQGWWSNFKENVGINDVIRDAERYREAMRGGTPGGPVTAPTLDGLGDDPVDPNTAILNEIKENTKKMVDIQRIILGGGEQGSLGITAVDVKGMRGGSRRSADPMAARLADAISDLLGEFDAGQRRSLGYSG